MSSNGRAPIPTVSECLETLEAGLFTKRSRTQGLQNLQLIFQDKDHSSDFSSEEVLRTLVILDKYLKLDIQSIPHTLNTVLSLLTNVEVILNIPPQDLLPSALSILDILKSLCTLETQSLRILGIQTFLSYPVTVLITIIRQNCSDVLQIFEDLTLQIHQGVSNTFHMFLTGLLSKLPPQEQTRLMQEGLKLWFKIITVIMNVCATVEDINQDSVSIFDNVKCLELMTEALVNVDYFQCSQWQKEILKFICDSKKYPATLLSLLRKNSSLWHRFWIVFVKLLKHQITRNTAYGIPIQSMLEVVETAFKMDAQNRCYAFQCWDVMIDSLSSDANAKSLPRYLKLLVIPLKPHNAKTEETARAKFYTWWNLIRKFQGKLDQFTNDVLIDFLHFMFGKKGYDKKHCPYQTVAGVGQTYASVKSLCIQAFAEIVGHDVDCTCCTDLPKLKEKMLNNKLLANQWDEWMSALKTAILITNSVYITDKDNITNKPDCQCAWKAFVVSIAQLPPNGVRKDMFNELIQVLIDLLQNCDRPDSLPDILFSLTLSVMEDDASIKKLLLASKEDEQPLCKIVSIIVSPKMDGVFERYGTLKMVEILRQLTDFVVESMNTVSCLGYLVYNNNSLKLWTALVQSINETQKIIDTYTLKLILKWPILAMQQTDADVQAVSAWQTLYVTYTKKSCNADFDKEITELIVADKNNSSYFKFMVAVCILKNRLMYPGADVGVYLGILENATAAMSDNKRYEQAIPIMVDTMVAVLEKVLFSSDEQLVKVSLSCVKNLLLNMFSQLKSLTNNEIKSQILVMVDSIFKALQPINTISLYMHIYCDFIDVLREYAISLDKDSSSFKCILAKVNYLRESGPNDKVKPKIDECIEILTGNTNKIVKDMTATIKVFASPNVNKIAKRSKRKETIIVNTSTENGEEYAVVKSNWKFNPKKMTENQREKLQRKRDDIPALYQDLSQSQDEFKLSKWKTDSQDTTTSSNSKSSKLVTNDDASSILKNITSSDVVPNIMQNILSQNDKNLVSSPSTKKIVNVLQTDKSDKVRSSTSKTPKSPRMALKDRVFRNVRNLIEKSSPKNEKIDASGAEYPLNSTPPAKTTNNSNIINSAPPLISADRPSRVRRIPKKFADVQLFGLKKRRHSQTDCLSQTENEIEILDNNVNQVEENINTDKAKLSIDNGITVNYESIDVDSDVIEVKEGESVQDEDEKNSPVSAHKSINSASNKTISENLDEIQNKEHTSDIKEHCITLKSNNISEKHEKEESEKIYGSQGVQENDDAQLILQEGAVQDININDSCQPCQNNDFVHVQDVLMDDVAQDNHENEPKSKVTDIHDTGDLQTDNDNTNKEVDTLKTPVQNTKQLSQKSTAKKSSTKKSRIEKELAIDMVEGHPFLKVQSEKRLTRNKLMESENVIRRKSLPQKSNKMKAQTKTTKTKEKESIPKSQESSLVTVAESQEKNTLPEDAPFSEDVIESSQDSNFTTVTVKPTKRTPKRQATAVVERLEENDVKITGTQDLLQDSDCEIICVANKSFDQETKDDIELPQNKTAEVDKNYSDFTENMDTQPLIDEKMTDDMVIATGDRESPITINSEKSVGLVTQELAEADTQPNDPTDFIEYEPNKTPPTHPEIQNTPMDITESMSQGKLAALTAPESQDDVIEISTEPNCNEKDTDICSPFKDEVQRKKDFLNNTLEISPIKAQSPDKDKTSPEKNEDTSSDYLVVRLSSPVHSNGEPFSSKGSPEVFTEDKTSPDKRDQSPPRAEVVANSGSPSSSLSLKKNRPQTLRPSGRAAHMVGLCVPDSINVKNNSEKVDPEEHKKPNPSIPARRNLRILYNSVSDNSDVLEDNEQETFLKLKKVLPSVDSSPSVPILKRKIDIVDDNTASPASKRKRVSFHDPPVSTTVSVQKYIKPDCLESPSTAYKRPDIQITRSLTKSPKRVENATKLDTVLSKAIESFKEQTTDSLTNDTNTSLDITPAVEVVITSELNDTDPICLDLTDCKDPIENIAVELSSPAMKDLFIKELEGKVLTVGDLAKMTELEVNRLCIKAPKVQVAKKVLAGYANKRVVPAQDMPQEALAFDDETAIATEMDEEITESELTNTTVETQTDEVLVCESSSQTSTEIVTCISTQTTSVSTLDTYTQTMKSGYETTSEIITSCLSEREDFIQKLGEILPTDAIIDLLVNKSDNSTTKLILTKFFERQSQNMPDEEKNNKELTVIKDFLLERFNQRDLISYCSRLLQGLYDRSA